MSRNRTGDPIATHIGAATPRSFLGHRQPIRPGGSRSRSP